MEFIFETIIEIAFWAIPATIFFVWRRRKDRKIAKIKRTDRREKSRALLTKNKKMIKNITERI